MHRLGITSIYLTALVSVGCSRAQMPGSSASDAATPAPPAPADPCEDRHSAACYDARRAACAGDAKVWKFGVAGGDHGAGPFYVSSTGLVRLDEAAEARVLYGTDSNRWTACTTTCPDSQLGRVCAPYDYPTGWSFDWDETCTLAESDREPWNGLLAKRLVMTCENGTGGEAVLVPELRPLRDAMLLAGYVDAGDGIGKLDGLVVSIKMGDLEMSLRDVSSADCSAFVWPEGFRMFRDHAAQLEYAKVAPPLQAALQVELQQISAVMLERLKPELWQRVKEIAGKRCALPEKWDDDALKACGRAHPDFVEDFGKAAAPMMEQMLKEAQGLAGPVVAARRRTLDKPLCEHFAGKP